MAVVHGLCREPVGVVCRCEMCKNLFCDAFYGGGIFHQKEPKADMTIFLSWAPPFPYNDSEDKQHLIHVKCLKHKGTQAQNVKRAKASGPPCISCLGNEDPPSAAPSENTGSKLSKPVELDTFDSDTGLDLEANNLEFIPCLGKSFTSAAPRDLSSGR